MKSRVARSSLLASGTGNAKYGFLGRICPDVAVEWLEARADLRSAAGRYDVSSSIPKSDGAIGGKCVG